MIEKLAQFPAPLPDETEYDHIALHVTGDFGQQGGLATTGSGKQPDTLALPQGHQAINRAHPRSQCAVDPRPFGRKRRLA